MTVSDELERKLSRTLNSLRQNRFKLEQYLITMQMQQQVLLDGLQKILEGQLNLQGTITGSLSQFEEKAGAGQGLQGIFNGNPLLKNEIAQKRVALEQSVQKLREMGSQLQHNIQQLSKTVQDVGRYISPEIVQEEKMLEELKELLDEKPDKLLLPQK